MNSTAAAPKHPTAPTRNGPDSSAIANHPATVAPIGTTAGPITAPTIVVHTTSERSRPRVPADDRSVAAKRACRLTAVPDPTPAIPTSINANQPRSTAAATTSEPAPAITRPVVNAGRRPRPAARDASGRPAAAAPSVTTVVGIPARDAVPDSSSPRIAPSASAPPIDRPARIWAVHSRTMVRRCRATFALMIADDRVCSASAAN